MGPISRQTVVDEADERKEKLTTQFRDSGAVEACGPWHDLSQGFFGEIYSTMVSEGVQNRPDDRILKTEVQLVYLYHRLTTLPGKVIVDGQLLTNHDAINAQSR